MAKVDTTAALTTIIDALKPLNSEDRRRTVDAAMIFLGEGVKTRQVDANATPLRDEGDEHQGTDDYPTAVRKWMRQHNITGDEIDKVFHFGTDGTFDIHGAPGRSMKEQTLNTYTLVGLGAYLTTNDRKFSDQSARGFCSTVGCLDASNHAAYLKDKGAEFSGDKNKGYVLTKAGEKRAAELVKELAGASK